MYMTTQEKYIYLREQVSSFQILQVGLCPVFFNPDGTFVAKPYNINVLKDTKLGEPFLHASVSSLSLTVD